MTAWPAPPDWAKNLFAMEGFEIVRSSVPGSWYVVKNGRRYRSSYNFRGVDNDEYGWYMERVQIWSNPDHWELVSVPFKS